MLEVSLKERKTEYQGLPPSPSAQLKSGSFTLEPQCPALVLSKATCMWWGQRLPLLHLGTNFIWNRAWRTPSLRTLLKTMEILVESNQEELVQAEQPSLIEPYREPNSPPGSTVNSGLKKLCACAGSYPFTKISAECGTDLKAFPNTCRPINTGQKLCWRKKLGQTLTNKLLWPRSNS